MSDSKWKAVCNGTWLEVIKLSFMLNSAEYEILNAHKYKSIKKISIFHAQISYNAVFPAHKC